MDARAPLMALGTALAGAGLTACGPTACPAVGYVSTVTLRVTPDRAQSLGALSVELCQDGACRSAALDSAALTGTSPGSLPPATPGALRARSLRTADGIIEVAIEAAINDHPLDVTANGTDAGGLPIGTSSVRLTPKTTYPYGRDCGGPTTASATLDAQGLRAG
ncbi:hypothetical protein [Sinomonas sp. R1AF57]|jgi:hypothetical protein|uniref:hypothetical protein n=1 Tax=Sinomonas sp. R1AF57 TaxID=2020377 RepID=UPI001ABF5DA8|nr:hypothetical protein [Sinomonas sp. R1AF57]